MASRNCGAEMTVLGVGHLAGSSVGPVPVYPTVWSVGVSHNAPLGAVSIALHFNSHPNASSMFVNTRRSTHRFCATVPRKHVES
jgi:hypothetical protein